MPKKTTTGVARTLIGYWHDREDLRYSHPQPLVNHAWETARRHLIVEYLKSAPAFNESLGHSYCRFGCAEHYWSKTDDPSKGEYREMESYRVIITGGEQKTVRQDASGYYVKTDGPLHLGHRSYCDDVWCWPEGLAHYVETHGIRLPEEFVAHAAARGFRARDENATKIEENYLERSWHDIIHGDDRFWREWCRTNAPFRYESDCTACNPSNVPCSSPRSRAGRCL